MSPPYTAELTLTFQDMVQRAEAYMAVMQRVWEFRGHVLAGRGILTAWQDPCTMTWSWRYEASP